MMKKYWENNLPPHSEEAEKSVLGAILLDNSSIHKVKAVIREDDFYKKNHKSLYKAMVKLSEKGESLDVLTLSSELKERKIFEEMGGLPWLSLLEDYMPTATSITHHAKLVKKLSIQRKYLDKTYYRVEKAFVGLEDPALFLQEAHTELFELAMELETTIAKKDYYSPEELSTIGYEQAEERYKNPSSAPGICTGYPKLDQVLRGLPDLTILSASTSRGKSALGLNMAVHMSVYSKIPTLFLNYEMERNGMINRVAGILSGVPCNNIATGSYDNNEFNFERVSRYFDALSKSKFYMTGNEPKNIHQTLNIILEHKVKYGIKVVVLDYLGEIDPTPEDLKRGEYITFGNWTQMLKGFCAKHDIKLILIAQLNRDADEGGASRAKIGGSWKIAQKADAFLIWDYEMVDNDDHIADQTQPEQFQQFFIKVDKNRNGVAPRTIYYDFNKASQNIAEL
jgi:replicative DNA helicase